MFRIAGWGLSSKFIFAIDLVLLYVMSSGSVAIAGSSATTTTLATSPTGSATFGQPVTLTATVSPSAATGKVMFYDSTTILGVGTISGGQAVVKTPLLTTGKRSLIALYGGDATYAGSLSPAVLLTVLTNPTAGFTLSSGSPFPVGSHPLAVSVADFNGDGNEDIAIASGDSANMTILLGNGAGGFTQVGRSPFATGISPISIAVADFNGDGRADLAVANNGTANVTVLLGTSTPPPSLTFNDFSGNGRSGALLYDPVLGQSYTALSNADGTYAYVQNLFTPAFDTLRTGDFDGDGNADLILYNSHTALAYIGLGNGDGTFDFNSLFWSPNYDTVETGDINGDGKTDVAFYTSSTGTLYTGISNGDGTFSYQYHLVSQGFTFVKLADFTGDGKADLFLYNATSA